MHASHSIIDRIIHIKRQKASTVFLIKVSGICAQGRTKLLVNMAKKMSDSCSALKICLKKLPCKKGTAQVTASLGLSLNWHAYSHRSDSHIPQNFLEKFGIYMYNECLREVKRTKGFVCYTRQRKIQTIQTSKKQLKFPIAARRSSLFVSHFSIP